MLSLSGLCKVVRYISSSTTALFWSLPGQSQARYLCSPSPHPEHLLLWDLRAIACLWNEGRAAHRHEVDLFPTCNFSSKQNCLFSLAEKCISLLHRTDLLWPAPLPWPLGRCFPHGTLPSLQIYMLCRSAYADTTYLLPDPASRCSTTATALGSALCQHCPVTGTTPTGLCRATPAPRNT